MVFIALSLTLLSCWVHLPAVFFSAFHTSVTQALLYKVRGHAQVWDLKIFQLGRGGEGCVNDIGCLLGKVPMQSDQLQVKWTPSCTSKAAKGFPNAKDLVESINPVCDEMDEVSILKTTGRTMKDMKMMLFIAKAEPICCRKEGGRAAFIAGSPMMLQSVVVRQVASMRQPIKDGLRKSPFPFQGAEIGFLLAPLEEFSWATLAIRNRRCRC